MEIRKEFYLPNTNKGILSLYNISYLESDFNLVTDKISTSFGNRVVDITDRLIPVNDNYLRKIKLKDKRKIGKKVYPATYKIYLQESPFLKPLTSINYGHDIISFDKIDTFIEENNNPKYLKALEEYLQIFNFEYKENYIKEQIIKKALDKLEKNRDFYKVERFLDQKYFLEVALENDYKRKEEIAKANERVLKLGNRIIF